jgi:predicted DNA-binding protein
MNQQEKNTANTVEDLTINEDQAEEVKGGRSTAPSVSEIVVTKDLD